MTPIGKTEHFDVVVVGAGQAGLAAGYYLSTQGRRFVILDAADSLGAAWAKRWASLVLFTPRRYDALPGLAFPGDPDGYPSRDEVVSYLKLYARTFALPVALNSGVWSMTKVGERFVLELAERTIEADAVVVATGPFQTPRVPRLAADLAPDVFQIHSADYDVPGEIPAGTVLVVGGGNTGFQIASELSSTHEVHLSIDSRQTSLPQRPLGRDLFWWLEKTRLMCKTDDTRLGRRLSVRDALIGSSRRALRRQGVAMEPRTTGASGRTILLADETELAVDAVIWATGFGLDHSWIELPVGAADGVIVHRRGVSDVPGLYFLGLPWQHTRGSALLGWVKDDAEHIAAQIAVNLAPSDGVREAGAGAAANRAHAGAERDRAGERRDRAARDAAADRRAASADRDAGATERTEAQHDREIAHAHGGGRFGTRVADTIDRTHASVTDDQGSSLDRLTGAYLPPAGFVELDREIARSRRTDQPLTLLTVDVDELHTVDEAWGHGAAERMIVEVAGAVISSFRSYDLVIRSRPDAFVCAIGGMGMAAAAKRLVRVNAALGEMNGSGWVAKTGLAELQEGESREELVARAAVVMHGE